MTSKYKQPYYALETVKVGSEVVVVRPTKDGGEPTTFSTVYIVTEWDERFKRWRYRKIGSDRSHGAFPVDGGCRDFMSKSEVPDYYMSANPAHIKAAKASARKISARKAEEQAANEARFKEFKKKLDALLKEYGASIYAEQTSGDDQGVEVAAYVECSGVFTEIDD